MKYLQICYFRTDKTRPERLVVQAVGVRVPSLTFREKQPRHAIGVGVEAVSIAQGPANVGSGVHGDLSSQRVGAGQLARNPHVTADNSRRQKHSTSSKPASRSALSSASSGKYRSSSDHAAKWPRACASVMP